MFAIGINTETILVQAAKDEENVEVDSMFLVTRDQFDAAEHRPVLIISEAAAFLLAMLFSVTRRTNVSPLPIQ